MPLSSFTLSSAATFAFDVPVTGWADLTQGDNQVAFDLVGLDTAVWNQAYAGVLPINGGANTTIDLKSFANLAGEAALALTKVLAILVKNTPAVAANTNCPLKITPGASNGLVWFAGATDGLILKANEKFTQAGDPAGTGVTVDATHKTLKFANTGADAANVTVVIVGSTL